MNRFFGSNMLLRIPALLIAITFHEYAHARASDALGDPTPGWTGRLSLNPMAHLDPIGLLMLWIFKFGWAKPVQIDPRYYKDPKKGIILVSFAGPLTNLLIALLTLILININIFKLAAIQDFLYILFLYNLTLAAFNLIPIPPLDGSKILFGLLPAKFTYRWSNLEKYGPLILIISAYLGIIDIILEPLISYIFLGLNALSKILLFKF